MGDVVSWAPLVWTTRVLLLIVMGGTGYVFILFLLRFLSWSNIKGMARAVPPEIESVGGEFGGAKAEVRRVAQGQKLRSMEQRLTAVEEEHAALVEAVKQMRADLKKVKRKG